MVCGFCPNPGSALEKSFNRADVFKRHLMAVHHVEQTPPNGRQRKGNSKSRSPTAGSSGDFSTANTFSSGKCSTCNVTFATAQQFYEHLDDCVLSKVVQDEPAAVANEANLNQISIEEVKAVLSSSTGRKSSSPHPVSDNDASDASDDDAEGEVVSDDDSADASYGKGTSRNSKSGAGRATRSNTTRKAGSSGNSR